MLLILMILLFLYLPVVLFKDIKKYNLIFYSILCSIPLIVCYPLYFLMNFYKMEIGEFYSLLILLMIIYYFLINFFIGEKVNSQGFYRLPLNNYKTVINVEETFKKQGKIAENKNNLNLEKINIKIELGRRVGIKELSLYNLEQLASIIHTKDYSSLLHIMLMYDGKVVDVENIILCKVVKRGFKRSIYITNLSEPKIIQKEIDKIVTKLKLNNKSIVGL
ncbi:hypothetical protein SRABI96_05249 [Peribacillus sp. Bi96]|uniref:hypothetical protein n=1 Tax=Peribacillus sp. Bi96 TaxID=2884273 RepID=UPI001D596C6B|nr:hypothetical protein [Peribacillus sp. Bi96]CAH0316621.1 hypothetical protein SRABI96_05249 [Peribacillus sp. Bi96]